MAIKITLFVLSISALLIFAGLAVFKFYQAACDDSYGSSYDLSREERMEKKAKVNRARKKSGIVFSVLAIISLASSM